MNAARPSKSGTKRPAINEREREPRTAGIDANSPCSDSGNRPKVCPEVQAAIQLAISRVPDSFQTILRMRVSQCNWPVSIKDREVLALERITLHHNFGAFTNNLPCCSSFFASPDNSCRFTQDLVEVRLRSQITWKLIVDHTQ
jgi:hypothetical protein